MSIRRDFPDLPPVWTGGTFVAQWAAAEWLPLHRLGEWSRPLGWLLIAAGFGLAVWAALWFRIKRTTIEPGERPTALIVEGPYRINRNPIYTAMAVVLLGAALALGALSALLLAVAFPLVAQRRFIVPEEAMLRDAFGAEADRYMARTRRW